MLDRVEGNHPFFCLSGAIGSATYLTFTSRTEKGEKEEKRREREKDGDINKVAALVVIHSYGGHRDAISGSGFS